MQTVLIVDDDVDVSQLLTFKLSRAGFRCVSAEDGREALKVFREELPDLVLLDVMIPVIDGFEVLQEMRTLNQNTPILMLTAKGQEADVIRGLSSGANDYVTKPFSPNEVLMRCKKWLDKHD